MLHPPRRSRDLNSEFQLARDHGTWILLLRGVREEIQYTVALITVNRLRCIEMIYYVIRFIFVQGSLTSVQFLSSQIVMNKFEVGHVQI